MHSLARRHGVHRRTVRQPLESPLPPERKRPERRPAPALGAYRELVDGWLLPDRGGAQAAAYGEADPRSAGIAGHSRLSGSNMCPGTYSAFCARPDYVAARVTRRVIRAAGGVVVPDSDT